MRIYYTDHFVLPLPDGHRFPMQKYAMLRERVVAFAGHLMEVPDAASDAELQLAHDADYVQRISAGTLTAAEQRRIGFPWSEKMVERSRRSTGATIAACRAALLSGGCGVNLAGGTHHACRDHGEGFCIFNDSAVAALLMKQEGRIRRALIVDLDVHQGNGSADILRDERDVYTFSMHGQGNYPFRKTASDLDIELPDGCDDAHYLAALDAALPQALAAARPDLILYLAGADPYQGDRLGRLALSKQGLRDRDARVFDVCEHHAIPLVISMAGGYGRDIAETVDIHAATVWAACRRWGYHGLQHAD